MTDPNKEKVLARWPDANSRTLTGITYRIWNTYDDNAICLGKGDSEPEAWADAARRLGKGE